jgi:hypothetical protein
MSAWIVSKRHIDYLVTAAVANEIVPYSKANETGRMLWKENLLSVAYRYPRDGDGGRPGPASFRDAHVDTYEWEPMPILSGNALGKTIACLSYQSCEHPDWEQSEAHNLLVRLRPAEDTTARGKEEEEATPWGW